MQLKSRISINFFAYLNVLFLFFTLMSMDNSQKELSKFLKKISKFPDIYFHIWSFAKPAQQYILFEHYLKYNTSISTPLPTNYTILINNLSWKAQRDLLKEIENKNYNKTTKNYLKSLFSLTSAFTHTHLTCCTSLPVTERWYTSKEKYARHVFKSQLPDMVECMLYKLKKAFFK